MTNLNIAFLGLGAMGQRIAQLLLNTNTSLTVYNRTQTRCAPLTKRGAKLALSPAQCVESADIVFVMVTDDDASRTVWLHPEHGALNAMQPTATAVDLSTLTPNWTQTLAQHAASRNLPFLAMPVVGTLPQAASGKLIGLLGGDTSPQLLDVLHTFCTSTHHVGSPQNAATAKLLINTLFATQTAALAQAIALGQTLGIPPTNLLSLLQELPITSPAMNVMGQLIERRMFDPLFPIDLVVKDLHYTVQTAHSADVHTPTFESTLNAFTEAQRHDLGSQNITAIASLYLDHARSTLQPEPS